MKILIIQTAFIGDVVLATPLIEALALKYPGCQIEFLLRKGNENLLEHDPRVANLLIWNKKEGKYKSLFRLIKKIKAEHYDLLLNLQRFGATGFLTWMSGAKKKIGFSKNPFSFSYHQKVAHEIGSGTHEVERNLKLIDYAELLRPKLFLPEATLKKVESYKEKPYLVIAPTSVWFTKQFPEEKWVEFLKELSFDGSIYLVGAPGDFDACQQIIMKSAKGENLCGKLSLLESAALMKDAQMNYVNDSAPMHFASAVNAPTTAIFCSTIPDFGFGPLSDKSFIAQTSEHLACRPCGLHGKKACPKGHFKCGMDIDVKQMINLTDTDLASPPNT